MKYFFDTEFIEGFHKPIFGKRRHFIDLISIGIVAEDGSEYSAISSEYNYKDASPWVRENVIMPLYLQTVHGDARNNMDECNFHKHYGKPNKTIAKEILMFVNPIMGELYDPLPVSPDYIKRHNCKEFSDGMTGQIYMRAQPEFVAYYSDYDWVLLCSLFGTMMQLPEGFPMYCIDLKQMLDGRVAAWMRHSVSFALPGLSMDAALKKAKSLPGYPKQENEHSALADAKWNSELYKWLMS